MSELPSAGEHQRGVDMPLVTIGVPVYNGQRFLARVLETLAQQTYQNYELVIVDNGSTDETPAICAEFASRDSRVRHIRYERTIPAVDNFWRTFQHARGTYFLWNAADDFRPADAIERAVAGFAADPGAVMVHGPVDVDLVKEQRECQVSNEIDLDSPSAAARVAALTRGLRHNGMLYGVYRSEALRRVRFRQHMGQDFLVSVQMALTGRIHYIDRPLIRYRHVNGPIDDPIYQLVWPTAKDLLGYWHGPRRRKAWTVLAKGIGYLMRVSHASLYDRLTSTAAYAVAFTGRFGRHLLSELLFLVTLPLAYAMRPVVTARKRNRSGLAHGQL